MPNNYNYNVAGLLSRNKEYVGESSLEEISNNLVIAKLSNTGAPKTFYKCVRRELFTPQCTYRVISNCTINGQSFEQWWDQNPDERLNVVFYLPDLYENHNGSFTYSIRLEEPLLSLYMQQLNELGDENSPDRSNRQNIQYRY